MTLIIKIGGAAGITTESILREIADYHARGEHIVLVHGCSDLTDNLAQQLGHPTRTITSPNGMTSRYTDAETLRIFSMAAGSINSALVAQLQALGVNALGLSGVDGRLLLALRKAVVRSVTPDGRVQILRDDYTGHIEHVNVDLLENLLRLGYLPVIAPIALSHEGERLNVDGDRAAALVASALHASALAIMTNVPGLLTDPQDANTVVHTIHASKLEEFLPYAQGRMRKKLLGVQEALHGGVERVYLGCDSLQNVLNGAGTTIAQTSQITPTTGDPAFSLR